MQIAENGIFQRGKASSLIRLFVVTDGISLNIDNTRGDNIRVMQTIENDRVFREGA